MKKLFSTICFALIAGLTSQAHAAKAINFNFTDSKGKTIQLSDYRGKWVLVNFWAPWCPRCKMEFPDLNDLDARPDFAVIGIAMDYGIDVGAVQTTMQRYNLRFPQVIGGNRRDPNSPALQIGPVDYYPTSYLYAPDGEIVMFVPGIISKMKIVAFTEQYEKNILASAQAGAEIQKASASTAPASAQNKKKVTMY
jgi:thiol-disulfide isomerase/thioredoxin